MPKKAAPNVPNAEPNVVPVEQRSIRVHAELAERLTVVSSASANLSLAIGSIEDGEQAGFPVLLPSIELSLLCKEDADISEFGGPIPFQQLVSWENAAFVVMRLAEDFADVSAQVRAVASGQVKPDPGSLKLVSDYMRQAQNEIARCLAELDRTSVFVD